MKLEEFDNLPAPDPAMAGDPERTPILRWLREQRTSERVALYASGSEPGSVFVHAVLIPTDQLERSWVEINDWTGNPFDHPSCGLVWSARDGGRLELHSPWEDGQPAVLMGATQLVFGRSFEGRLGERTYFELTQDITHAHGLHWLEERQAWCRFNDEGDIVELAGVSRIGKRGNDVGTLVWIERQLLETHMAATGTCLAQMFDCAWFSDVDQMRALDELATFTDPGRTLSCKFAIRRETSCFRGVQFITPSRTARQIGESELAAREDKEYETFIIHDWKNDQVVECSCDPAALASYFDADSTAPFETSPVFFRPDVLDRYKADREKYRLTDRTLSCRNAWSLTTYDVNDAGQVHTYITYLGKLPIAEQRYWRSFNEPPKGPISKRAFQSDFEGRWETQPDALRDLKELLRALDRSEAWFRIKEPALLEHVNYPLTSAFKPWDDAIIDLAKLVVEGLEHKVLVTLAGTLGRRSDSRWRSIRWMKEALIGLGLEDGHAAELVAPLEQLQLLRTKLPAHAGGTDAVTLRRDLLAKHKTPKAHVSALARDLHEALTVMRDVLRGGDDRSAVRGPTHPRPDEESE
jgi:hypothetical protein